MALLAGTSMKKSMDRKHRVRNMGHHDDKNGEGMKDTVCTRAFKLSYDREVRELDPNSGANYFVSGDYCGVMVNSRLNNSNVLDTVQMAICKF